MFEIWDHIRSSNRAQALVIAALVLAAVCIGTAMQSQKSESLAKELAWLQEKSKPNVDPCWGIQSSPSWTICAFTRQLKVETNPESISNDYYGRASAYIRSRRYDLALRDLNAAVAQKGISPRTLGIGLLLRGGDKLVLRDPAGAESDLTLARSYLPQDERWYADYGRGLSRIELDNPEMALRDFDEAAGLLRQQQSRLATTMPDALLYLSSEEKKKWKDEWSAGLSKGIARCYSGRGVALRSLGRYSQSIFDYDVAIRMDPSDLSSYSGRSLTEFAMGNWRAGFEDFWKHTKLVLNFGGKP